MGGRFAARHHDIDQCHFAAADCFAHEIRNLMSNFILADVVSANALLAQVLNKI